MEQKTTDNDYYKIVVVGSDNYAIYWPEIEELVKRAFQNNPFNYFETGQEVFRTMLENNQAAAFVCYCNDVPELVLGMQFCRVNGKLGASVTCLGGKNFVSYNDLFQNFLVEWLQENGFSFMDVCTDWKRARAFSRITGIQFTAALGRVTVMER
ncbi:MAG: hypothetical protein QW318_07955 [Candidatus Caldarchaeum sp.]